MGCPRTLNLNAAVTTTDMPLDNSILATSTVAGGEFIWGVRGPYVFKINSTTGLMITKAKVDHEMNGPTCIAYDSVSDRLKIMGWNKCFPGITDNESGPNSFFTYFTLYTVNPSTLLVDSAVMLSNTLGVGVGQSGTQTGTVSLKYMGAGAQYGLWGLYRTDDYSALFRHVAGTVYTKKFSDDACFGNILNDFTWDGIDNLYWSNSQTQEVMVFSMADNNPSWTAFDTFNVWTADSSIPFGIEVAPSTGDIYVGTQNGAVKRLTYSAGFSLISTLNVGVIGTIYKIRYNPFDGLLYCAVFGQDSVAVVNPASNTLNGLLRTGYDSPWDFVFSSTKTWVIQGGNLGVKLFV